MIPRSWGYQRVRGAVGTIVLLFCERLSVAVCAVCLALSLPSLRSHCSEDPLQGCSGWVRHRWCPSAPRNRRTARDGGKAAMSPLATRVAVASSVVVLFVSAAVVWRHWLTWKLVVTVAAVRTATATCHFPVALARCQLFARLSSRPSLGAHSVSLLRRCASCCSDLEKLY